MRSVTEMVTIRPARPADAVVASALASAAKAKWPYPQEWLEEWTGHLTITEAYLASACGFIAEQRTTAVGVCAVTFNTGTGSLDHLWVAPAHERQGIGSRLLAHAVKATRRAGCLVLEIVSDPFAEPFYLKAGARRVGAIPAPMAGAPDRILPRLHLTLV